MSETPHAARRYARFTRSFNFLFFRRFFSPALREHEAWATQIIQISNTLCDDVTRDGGWGTGGMLWLAFTSWWCNYAAKCQEPNAHDRGAAFTASVTSQSVRRYLPSAVSTLRQWNVLWKWNYLSAHTTRASPVACRPTSGEEDWNYGGWFWSSEARNSEVRRTWTWSCQVLSVAGLNHHNLSWHVAWDFYIQRLSLKCAKLLLFDLELLKPIKPTNSAVGPELDWCVSQFFIFAD